MKSIPQYFSLSNTKHNHSSNKRLIWYPQTIPCLKYSMIFKEQLTNISTVLNNTGNTTKLLTSFSALDASQQKVLLSSKLLTEEQKNSVL